MHIQSPAMSTLDMRAQSNASSTVAAESLWAEHGWGLSGRHVAFLVGAVLIVSMALRILG